MPGVPRHANKSLGILYVVVGIFYQFISVVILN